MNLSAEIFELIMRSLTPRQIRGSDQRKAARMILNSSATIFPLIDDDVQTPISVLVQDVSSSGMRFITSYPVTPGSEFIVQLPRVGSQALLISCTVLHCTADDGGTVIGAKFDREINGETADRCALAGAPVCTW